MLCSADHGGSEFLCGFRPWDSESDGLARAVGVRRERDVGGAGCVVFGVESVLGWDSQFT